ncbi:MAG: 5-oxoprolinase subunit PxpA [Burkholderiales bacterium]
MKTLDLNCDMGEGFGAWKMGEDAALLDNVTSANIACGFHAGDPGTMRRTVSLAMSKNVALGAHPSLPDLQGFGRRTMSVSAEEVRDLIIYQVGALAGTARALGGTLSHVKPHGALYNMAAENPALARAIAEAIKAIDSTLILFALADSELLRAGAQAGLRVASEVFADRTYQSDGSLTPRTDPDALIQDTGTAIAQVRHMVSQGFVRSIQGIDVPVTADTLCIHGDQPDAVEFSRKIRAALEADGVRITRMGG